MEERRIAVADGELAVIDHGGDPGAVPVLFVHSPGSCAATWQFVVRALSAGVHAFALDLPGHGYSTMPVRSFRDPCQAIATVVRELGLDRPLLVAHDQSTYFAALAVLENPDLVRGVIAFGGGVMDDAGRQEWLDFLGSDTFAEMLRERFYFGVRGTTRQEAEALIDGFVGHAENDWLLAEMRAGLRTEVERSMEYAADGTWLHKPEVDTILTMARVPDEPGLLPGPGFYDRLTVPLWTIQLREGYETLSPDNAESIAAHPLMRYAYLDSNAWPQYDKPDRVAAIVEQIAADPNADTLPETV